MFGKNFILLTFILMIFYGCGYSPTFKDVKNKNLKIEITEMNGDNLINSYISTKLKTYTKNKSNLAYKIRVFNNYEKKDLSKDSTGKITNYELKFKVEFNVTSTDSNKKITIEDSFLLKNTDDAYKDRQNENSIKKDFSSLAVEKLILELLLFQ